MEEMLTLIERSPEGGARVPAGRDDEDWEHNALTLDDLFAEGYVRADFPPMKDGAGAYSAYVGLRLTDRARRRIREAEAEGGSHDGVVQAAANEIRLVERFLSELQRVEDQLELANEDRLIMEAEKATLEAQIRSPRPNRSVLKWAMRGAVLALGAAANGVLGGAAWEAISALG